MIRSGFVEAHILYQVKIYEVYASQTASQLEQCQNLQGWQECWSTNIQTNNRWFTKKMGPSSAPLLAFCS